MINCAVLIGRLTTDPVLKVTPSGKDVCTFQIAVDRAVINGQRTADFITIVAWENAARFVCNYFKKGQLISVQGSIRTRTYEDSKRNKRTAFEIVAKELSFCGDKSSDNTCQKDKYSNTEGINGYYANATPSDFEEISDEEDITI